jgi:uncharacterized protein YceK
VTMMAVFAGGCASMGTRFEHAFSGGHLGAYPGVREDARFAVSPARTDPKQWPGVFFTAPLALADMPLSAVVDTCALPCDLKR